MGGTIRDCKAVYGGAVAVLTNGAFHMHGGAITGNRAQENGGGVYNGDNATFDGKCIIDDNHIGLGDKETEENVYTGQFRLYTDDQIAVGLTEGSKVGITYMYGKGQITEEYSNPAFDQAKQTDYGIVKKSAVSKLTISLSGC